GARCDPVHRPGPGGAGRRGRPAQGAWPDADPCGSGASRAKHGSPAAAGLHAATAAGRGGVDGQAAWRRGRNAAVLPPSRGRSLLRRKRHALP
ncbi:hypothetical protein, partial [Halovibrio sp. HP20-59]|uniref:hypothetical protein n=1 Tax=Halovibrio sp. HP20-59 TaxID=3080275 RepID=UPI002AFE93FA